MTSIGSLSIDLALESSRFVEGIKKVQQDTAVMAKGVQSAFSLMKGAAIGFAGTLTADFLVRQVGAAFDYADAIVDLANVTGASTKVLQEFRYAAQMSGSSVESADAAMSKFTKNLGSAQNGNQAMAKSFRDIGVSAKDPDEALRQFMDGIAKLPTAAQRQSAAMELMGKSAGELAPLLGEGAANFDTMAIAARNYGIVIDDHVLRNAGQVNDQLDTMRMILTAQMANAIIQNADALMSLANGFITAASAAANFFATMKTEKLMSVANGVNLNSDLPTVIAGRIRGKSNDEISTEARREMATYKDGRERLHADLTKRYNDNIRAGRNKNDPEMQGILAEREGLARAERESRRGRIIAPGRVTGNRPTPIAKSSGSTPKKTSAPSVSLRSDAELAAQWRDFQRASSRDQLRATLALQTDPDDRYDTENKLLGVDYADRLSRIGDDTGTDREVREGKKRLTKEQADQLILEQQATYWMKERALLQDRDADMLRDSVMLKTTDLEIEEDSLSAQAELARTAKQRRDIALKQVANQFAQEKLQLEQVIELEKLGKATKKEREAAERRLANLPARQAEAEGRAKRDNKGPLGDYMDGLPRDLEEINEAFEKVQVEGLQGLENDMLDVIKGAKSIGDAFSNMASTIIDGLLRIAIQQAIIKPLGNLLFGAGEGGGGGGVLGSLINIGVKAIPGAMGGGIGARANGGLSRAGDYLVGERGPELVRFGNTANVVPTRALNTLASNDNSSAPTININGPITSNDPEMVRRMIYEGVAEASPLIAQQATDRTMAKLRRGTM